MSSELSNRVSRQRRLLRPLEVVAVGGLSVIALVVGWLGIFASLEAPAYPAVPLLLLACLAASSYLTRSKWWLSGPLGGATLGAAAGMALNVLGGYALQGF